MTSFAQLKTGVYALAAAASLATASPGLAAPLGRGQLAAAPAHGAAVTQVGYWHRGRWYNGCWNCGPRYNNGAAVGAGIALGVLGAAAIAGAAASAPPPPVVYYEPAPPPVVIYQPAPEVYLDPVPRPRSCWVATGPGGTGYWSPC